jgi:hypothetical protein
MSNCVFYEQNIDFENVRGSSRSPVQTQCSVIISVLLNLSKFHTHLEHILIMLCLFCRISFCEKFFDS